MDKHILYSAWLHVNEDVENLRKSAIYYKGLLARNYGKDMSAKEYEDCIQQRKQLTTMIDVLIDYLAYDEKRLSALQKKGFSFIGEANAAIDELLKKL